jgi:hypothetical protein
MFVVEIIAIGTTISLNTSSDEFQEFLEQFQYTYNITPGVAGVAAAYAYDSYAMVMDAIHKILGLFCCKYPN